VRAARLAGFGFVRTPIPTAAIVAPIIALASYGAWLLVGAQRQPADPRATVDSSEVAAGVVGVLFTYIGYYGSLGN
jgi:hypothetical protein